MTSDPCCADGHATERANPPGQPTLRYRLGTWHTFRRAMVDALPAQVVPPDGGDDAPRPLAALTTRADDDPTIALIDAAAAVCDVLTFYSERILVEGYLETAVEERSVAEIARNIGYEPAPGVAASAALAITVDPNRTEPLTLASGLPVMSVPGEDGELPVTFETSEDLEARAEWNVLRPRATVAQELDRTTDRVYLQGVDTRLRPGDPLVLVGAARRGHRRAGGDDPSEHWDLRFVTEVTPVTSADHTVVGLDRPLGDRGTGPASDEVAAVAFRGRGGLFGWNAPDPRLMPEDVRNNTSLITGGADARWVAFRTLADDGIRKAQPRAVDLDREYPGVVTDGWICLQSSTEVELYRVERAIPAQRVDFSLSGRVTRVTVDSAEHLDDFVRRATAVLLDSEELALAERPDDSRVGGTQLVLDTRPDAPLPMGRTVVVAGDTDDGEPLTTVTTLEDYDDGRHPVLTLADELPDLVRSTVRIHANVAWATHGAAVVEEVLGSGDASVAHQRFALRHQPVTWIPAPPHGAEPTVEIRVDGVRWDRVTSLFTAGPLDRVYTLELDDDGSTVVGFGDGRRGARLPTGTENVRATYREGIGLAGEVAPRQLSLLQKRPPGLQAVENPRAASGADDPDALADIRRLAPLTVLTLDRLVALDDYERYAASFPGIGKALGVRLWDGRRGFIHVTVAAASGGVLETTDTTVVDLTDAFAALQDPTHHVVVDGHREVRFGVTLRVAVDDAYVEADVHDAVADALGRAFAFDARQFGQPVTAAQVMTVVHGVAGVVAVDVEALYCIDAACGGIPNVVLTADVARTDGDQVTRTELLLVAPDAIDIRGMDDT